MNIDERWKKMILNKWIVYKRGNKNHYFLLTELFYFKLKLYQSYYKGYYIEKIKGRPIAFEYLLFLPYNSHLWLSCKYMKNNNKLIEKFKKRITKAILKGNENFINPKSSVIKEIF